VDQLLARVKQAGATILKRPPGASDRYSGHFADLDGNVWQIVSDS
jgi:predicted lactoylglutathione lyase